MKTKVNLILATLLPLIMGASSLCAQPVTKADNNENLSKALSWVGGVVPTSADTILFNQTIYSGVNPPNRNFNIGTGISVQGIQVENTSGFTTISQNGTTALSIGSGGLQMNQGPVDKGVLFLLSSYVNLTANQTWNVGNNSILYLENLTTTAGTKNFNTNGNSLAINGTGSFIVRRQTDLSGVTIGTSNFSLDNRTARVDLGTSNTFGKLTITGGTLRGSTIGNYGSSSSFGTGQIAGVNQSIALGSATTTTNTNGITTTTKKDGILEYTGTSASTDRDFTRHSLTDSGIDVTTAGQTLTISGKLTSGGSSNTGTEGWVFGGAGNLDLDGVVSNASASLGATAVKVTKNGTGTLSLSAANTFTGDLTINGGTVIGDGVGNLSKGNIIVGANGTLTLLTNNEIFEAANIYLSTGSTLNMDFGTFLSGIDIVGGIYLNGIAALAGTYTAQELNDYFHVTNVFFGTGKFTVVPEPSTYLLLLLSILLACYIKLRKRGRSLVQE